MVKPWYVVVLVLFISACSSAVAPIICRQANVPTLTLVSIPKLVPIGNASVYTLSVTNAGSGTMGVFSDPELANVLDTNVPPCSTFVVSEETTNYKGARVAYVLRVIEWRGERYAYWGLSGYLPRNFLAQADLPPK